MYRFLKIFLFRLDAEKAHYFTMGVFLGLLHVPGMAFLFRSFFSVDYRGQPVRIAGLQFKHPVGLAAGFDKNAKFIRAMSLLGFSHIEVGTVTPRPQPGNPKPRLFRLKISHALINRMGFNNDGVEAIARQLQRKRPKDIIVGANIGKNKDTPNERAVEDYVKCFQTLYPHVDYFTVNVSSPNTPGLRELQDRGPLTKILSALQELNHHAKPVFLKIAPDLTWTQLDEITEIVAEVKLSGIIATNTTLSREGLKEPADEIERTGAGGVSGEPVLDKAAGVVAYLRQRSAGRFDIIGVGGIHDGLSAKKHLMAGASLIQVYTGLIYSGPGLVRKILRDPGTRTQSRR